MNALSYYEKILFLMIRNRLLYDLSCHAQKQTYRHCIHVEWFTIPQSLKIWIDYLYWSLTKCKGMYTLLQRRNQNNLCIPKEIMLKILCRNFIEQPNHSCKKHWCRKQNINHQKQKNFVKPIHDSKSKDDSCK